MDVERECVQGESVGDGAGEVLEKRRRREGEGVAHCCCCCCLGGVTRLAAEVRKLRGRNR